MASPNSREEFETRMSKLVSRLETTDTIFFYKRVTKTMATQAVEGPWAYSLEFPRAFLRAHGKKLSMDVTFTTIDSDQTWPIRITLRARCSRESKARVFAYGLGGWKTFLMDNHIKVGDFVIFKLLSFARFQVCIGRSPVDVCAADANSASQGNLPAETCSCSPHSI